MTTRRDYHHARGRLRDALLTLFFGCVAATCVMASFFGAWFGAEHVVAKLPPDLFAVGRFDATSLVMYGLCLITAVFRPTITYGYLGRRDQTIGKVLIIIALFTISLAFSLYMTVWLWLRSIPGLDGSEVAILLLVGWTMIELVAGLLPALLRSGSRAARQSTSASRRTGVAPESRGADFELSAPRFGHVMDFVRHVARHGELPSEAAGIHLEPDGTIVTTQAALKRILAPSKSTINRQIHAMAATGRLIVVTTESYTSMRLPDRSDDQPS